jgi:hypothetical protein
MAVNAHRHTADEVNRARWRPEEHRTPIPDVGDRVLFRPAEDAGLIHATVLEVTYHDPEGVDWNCWRVRTNPATAAPVYDEDRQVILDPHPDAWPTLLLKVDGQASHTMTREARLPGSAGWLPLPKDEQQ